MSDNSAGYVNTQEVEVPSQRHLDLYRLLRANARPDRAGRLVCWWSQPKLAAQLGISVRTLQNLLADLRQPGTDPRHPKRAAGKRLGLVKVEATSYTDAATGRHRLGANLYVLTVGQHATFAEAKEAAQVNTQGDPVACLEQEDLQLQQDCRREDHRPTARNHETTRQRADDDLRAAWRAVSRQLGPVKLVDRWPNNRSLLEVMTAAQLRREQGRVLYGGRRVKR